MAAAALSKHVPIQEARRTEYRTFSVTPISPHIGAEIRGVDLGDLSDAQLQDIREAWADWMVLVFRDQRIDREAHKAFGRKFGHLHVHPMNHARPNQNPEILVVKTTAKSAYTAGEGWHTDVTCDAIPPLGSMLITETPECGGGDTLWDNRWTQHQAVWDYCPYSRYGERVSIVGEEPPSR